MTDDIVDRLRGLYERCNTRGDKNGARAHAEAATEIERACTSEREGWRYADELKREVESLRRERDRLEHQVKGHETTIRLVRKVLSLPEESPNFGIDLGEKLAEIGAGETE